MNETSLFNQMYQPDVLTCLADLSNDEIFTPPTIANEMLDLLPKSIWSNPNIKILDPACKSGVFLREAAKRFIDGEKDVYPDLQERIDHIFHEQLFGIAITELTSLISRRSVYCSKYPNSVFSVTHFDTSIGNILYHSIHHTWKNGSCIFCGAAESQYKRSKDKESHAYEFIHTKHPEEIWNMRFDVIIGNPPYQLSDGGAGPSAMPIYQHFVEQAFKLNPRYITMIIPARWYAGGKGLDEFRNRMLNDGHIRELTDYESSKDCFSGVDIAGGVCYFLWDRDNPGDCKITNVTPEAKVTDTRALNEFPIFIRSNEAIKILKKVLKQESKFVSENVLTQKPFGFRTYARGKEKPFEGAIKLYHSQGVGYVSRSEVTKNADAIDKYKIIVGRLVPSNGELDVKPGEGYRVITKPKILYPQEINTESYITIGVFSTLNEAENYTNYICGKFARFLLRQAVSSVNINRDVFKFVPMLDFTRPWTDSDLYEKYGLTDSEKSFVEKYIRPLD